VGGDHLGLLLPDKHPHQHVPIVLLESGHITFEYESKGILIWTSYM
jgi:hypothetical protein